MLTNTSHSPYAKVSPLNWNDVNWTNGLWREVFDMCSNHTIPHLQSMFEDKDISHVLENFRICAGRTSGIHDGTVFGDGDFYKWMEAALYAASKTNNTEQLNQIEDYIQLISDAQLDDGYISTKQIIGMMADPNFSRLSDINDFEVYNLGHLFTVACLHKRITNKDHFLDIAKKAANYLDNLYDIAAKTGNVQTAVCPSHYMGLIELYRTTKDKRYLTLATLAITMRDCVMDGTDDNQDRIPLKDHKKIVGHAVRATYLYAGATDLYAENGDESLFEMLQQVWTNFISKKLYLTGGCGALYNGTSPYGNFFIDQKIHQAFGYEYQLPNITAYNETCASIGAVLWSYRLFQTDPKAEYFDSIERIMLNVNLAAINLEGNKYFYQNALRRTKKLDYTLIWPLERSSYILSYCCPPNLARTLIQSSEYAYCRSLDTLWLGLYGANEAHIILENGTSFTLLQQTNYPDDGLIRFAFSDISSNPIANLNLRIPGWLENGYIKYQKKTINLTRKEAGTYITIPLSLSDATSLELFFDMPIRYTIGHAMIEEVCNQVALERGPLVYCLETPDVSIETLDDLLFDLNASYTPIPIKIANRSIISLSGEMLRIKRKNYQSQALYQNLNYKGLEKIPVQFIPYYAWDNRGFGEMRIWMPIAYH